jgi:hypothetical protein
VSESSQKERRWCGIGDRVCFRQSYFGTKITWSDPIDHLKQMN